MTNFSDSSISELNLSVRAYNCLKRGNINEISELCSLTAEELATLRNMNEESVEEITSALAQHSLALASVSCGGPAIFDSRFEAKKCHFTSPATPCPDPEAELRRVSDKESPYVCPHCGKRTSFNCQFDAYYCPNCDIWVEEKCDNPNCEYCSNRPDKPSMCRCE